MAVKHECRVLVGQDTMNFEAKLNDYLSHGWHITHMSTALGTDTSGDYPQMMHRITVIVECGHPATDEEGEQ